MTEFSQVWLHFQTGVILLCSNGRSSGRLCARIDDIALYRPFWKSPGPRRIWSFPNPLNQILIRIPEASDSVQTKHAALPFKKVMRMMRMNMQVRKCVWNASAPHAMASNNILDAAYFMTCTWWLDVREATGNTQNSNLFRMHVSEICPASVHISKQRKEHPPCVMKLHLRRAHFRKDKHWENPLRETKTCN